MGHAVPSREAVPSEFGIAIPFTIENSSDRPWVGQDSRCPIMRHEQTKADVADIVACDPEQTWGRDGLIRRPPIQSRWAVALKVDNSHGRRMCPAEACRNLSRRRGWI